jgi:hypothetical protein
LTAAQKQAAAAAFAEAQPPVSRAEIGAPKGFSCGRFWR